MAQAATRPAPNAPRRNSQAAAMASPQLARVTAFGVTWWRAHQRVAIREVVVQRADGHAGALRDLGQRRALQALERDQLLGGFEDRDAHTLAQLAADPCAH